MQFYLIRRGEQEYQAPSIESLKQWAEQGRLKKTDQIFDIESKTWIVSAEFHALKDFFQSQKLNYSAFDWIIKRKDQQYPVKDFIKLEQWARDGKLGPLDLLIDQKNKEEKKIKDIPQLFSLIPEHIQKEYLDKIKEQALEKSPLPQSEKPIQEQVVSNQQVQLQNAQHIQTAQINDLPVEGALSFDLSLFEPIYDFIRLYMICEPLKLFDVLKKSTYIAALDLDFAGFEKIAIYNEYLIHLQKHLNEYALPYQVKVYQAFNQTYQLWLEQLQKMIFLLDRLSLQYQNQEIELIQAEEALTAYQIKESIYELVALMKEIKALLAQHSL